MSIRRYLVSEEARGHALVCTHSALTGLEEQDLPNNLEGRVLIIDEAHHVSADGLSRVAQLWRARGGRLILVTATPYRGDGLPVVLPDMVHLRRSLAEHMDEGFAPRTLASEIMALGRRKQRVSAAQLAGEIAPPCGYSKSVARAIAAKWKEDGRPKTIVRVPPGRGGLIGRLISAFEREGARVLDATGVERERKVRFLEVLDAERERSVDTSQVDVIVGIQRVLEGTDWPHCAAVYSVGIPRSLHVVVQLAGRALRRKPEDYPSAYRDLARLVFFVPCAGGEALAELPHEHSRHVLLTCAFMADHTVGQAWIVTAAVQRGVRRAFKGGTEAELEAALDTARSAPDPTVRAEAQLALAVAREELLERGQMPKTAWIIDEVRRVRPDLPQDVIQEVMVEALATQERGLGEQVRARLELAVAARVRIDPQVQEAMKAAFSRVIAEFRDATLSRSPALEAIGRQVHMLTGGAMRAFAARLAAAQPKPLDLDQVLAWADAEYEATGSWPTANSGVVRGAPDENWGAIDGALREGHRTLLAGGSLARLLEERRGVANRLGPRVLTTDLILSWARAHHRAHAKWPKRDSGEIDGTPFTWSAVDQALIHGRHGLEGGTSLAQLLQSIGVKNVRQQPALTDDQVAAWARTFRDAHGRWPTRTDGDVDDAPGESWRLLAAAIEQGLRGLTQRASLPAFCHDLCGAPAPGTVRRLLTVEQILEWARAYYARTGQWPSSTSTGPELPRGETWRRIDRALREGFRDLKKTTLARLLAEHLGARNANRPGPIAEAEVWTLVCAHLERTGEYPTRDSGPVVGAPGENWQALDGALKHKNRGFTRGETLRQFIERMRAST